MFIQVSSIRNFPSSNLNRDDTGAPKRCIFGGVQRGRISSACWKRAARKSADFSEYLKDGDLNGFRTRYLPKILTDEILAQDANDPILDAPLEESWSMVLYQYIRDAVFGSGKAVGGDDADEETDDGDGTKSKKMKLKPHQIMFFSPMEQALLKEAVISLIKETPKIKAFSRRKGKDLAERYQELAGEGKALMPITPDICFFGRMSTSDDYFSSVDAAVQVAHAISTHKMVIESDYFTTLDDMFSNGSAHIGTFDYNSCCYYNYFNIDVDSFEENLALAGLEKKDVLAPFLKSAIRSLLLATPTGKQNSFAAHTLPAAILVEIQDTKRPISYVNAFVDPVTAGRDQDLISNSIQKLCDEVEYMDKDWGFPLRRRLWFCSHKYKAEMPKSENCQNFNELIEKVAEEIMTEV